MKIAQLDATRAIFEVSTALVLRIHVLRVVTLRSRVIDSRRFERTYRLHLQGLRNLNKTFY